MPAPPPRPAPAFYALPPGRLHDWVTLLHLPYTAWCLGAVAIGLGLAPAVGGGASAGGGPGLTWTLVGQALGAFALAVGVAAHALDELRGRPLGTAIPAWALWAAAAVSLAGACALGVWAAADGSWWLLAFVGAGGWLVVAYNLELPGFHNDLAFALAWGGFPVLTGAFAAAHEVQVGAVVAALAAALLAHAQRLLSTHARRMRRRVAAVRGELELAGGVTEPLTRETLFSPAEPALRALATAVVLLGAALVLARLL